MKMIKMDKLGKVGDEIKVECDHASGVSQSWCYWQFS